MINKNLKALSIFLILAVFILGAASAVSADEIDAGTVNATANPTEISPVTQNAANTAQGGVAGTIVTTTLPEKGVVQVGTVVTEGSLVFDGNIYDENGTKISTGAVDTTSTITLTNGVYTGTVSLTSISDLKSETIYYAGATLTNGKASADLTEDQTYVANVGVLDGTNYVETLYLPFRYLAKYNITVADQTTIYSDDWTVTGRISDANGPVTGVATITFTKGTETYTTTTPVINGVFTLNNTALNKNLSAGVYKLEVTYDTDYYNTAEFTVLTKNITMTPSISNETAYYNNPSTLTVVLTDEEGYSFKEATDLTYTIINLNDGNTVTLTDSTSNGTAIKLLENTAIVPGSYIIRINAVSENYAFQQVAVNYVVIAVPTTINVTETPLVVSKDGNGVITITVLDAEGEDLDVNVNNINVMVYDSTNVPKTTILHPNNDGTYTVTDANVDTGDYLKIDFAAVGYESSQLIVPIVIKEGTTVTVTPTSASYNYGGNTNITVLLTTHDSKLLNTTVVILNGNDTIGAIQLTNGVGNYSLETLNLDANDEAYSLTIKYLGDDTYKASQTTLPVTVSPIYGLGTLKANATLINYNVNSKEEIQLNLTSLTNMNQLVPYNGILTYTINGNNYNVTMTNGVVVIPVSDLEELNKGLQTYTFKILGNNRSNQVNVIITTSQLEGSIEADNISANNNTPIEIAGVIKNAADGTVTVTLKGKNDKEIATYIADVEKDGSFVASFAPVKDGNYTATIEYNNDGAIGVSNGANLESTVSIKVEGSTDPQPPEPTPTGDIQTYLTIDDFSEIVDAGKNLTGRLLDENGTPIVGMHITLTLTRLSNGQSKDYFTTTDYKGEFQFPINLAVGNYTAFAKFDGLNWTERNITYLPSESNVTPFYVLPENGTEPDTPGNDTTVIITANPFVGTYGVAGNFTATFTNINGTPLVGYRDCIEITLTRVSSGASKTYTYFVPDYKGEITMPVELAPGEYAVHIEFTGSTVPAVYDPATADSTITVNR